MPNSFSHKYGLVLATHLWWAQNGEELVSHFWQVSTRQGGFHVGCPNWDQGVLGAVSRELICAEWKGVWSEEGTRKPCPAEWARLRKTRKLRILHAQWHGGKRSGPITEPWDVPFRGGCISLSPSRTTWMYFIYRLHWVSLCNTNLSALTSRN